MKKMNKFETWKDIPGYQNFYQVSTLGNVKRIVGIGCKKDRILQSKLSNDKRLFVCLSKHNIQQYHRVHRLVLETFVGSCPIGMECRHLDGNAINNQLNNLEWNTHIVNIQDKVKHGTMLCGTKIRQAKLIISQVEQIKQLLKLKRYTQRQIAKMFNISFQTISLIKLGKIWKHI